MEKGPFDRADSKVKVGDIVEKIDGILVRIIGLRLFLWPFLSRFLCNNKALHSNYILFL